MPRLLHDILIASSELTPDAAALRFGANVISYFDFLANTNRVAGGLQQLGISQKSRVAILLPNCPQVVITSFATSLAGGIFVIINPLQRPRQITHILRDSGATTLVTTRYLYQSLEDSIRSCPRLFSVVFSDSRLNNLANNPSVDYLDWHDISTGPEITQSQGINPNDPVSIIYTSGSTGPAKGVVLSHANLVSGAKIVSSYLNNRPTDRVLAALPLSFDYGFSQVTTSFLVGAEVVVTNYSMPQSLVEEISEHEITALAGVPTMWAQLSTIAFPNSITNSLRYITNSGGRLPTSVLNDLIAKLPNTRVFLMYGLTEAFRSTFLDPKEVGDRPNSIGKAISGVKIDVVREDGSSCDPGEPGELVHSGELVALGYWNNAEATARRFKPIGMNVNGHAVRKTAVWSGDIVRADSDGFLYFVERGDEMIKASGYRVSPSEVEDVVYSSNLLLQAVAIGLSDDIQGQKVALAVVPKQGNADLDFALRHICARELPPYMQPGEIRIFDTLPQSPNGKPDRRKIAKMFT